MKLRSNVSSVFLLAAIGMNASFPSAAQTLPRLPVGQQYTTHDMTDEKGCLIPAGTEIMVQGGSYDQDDDNARSMEADPHGRPARGTFQVFIVWRDSEKSHTCRNFGTLGPRDITNFTTPTHPRPVFDQAGNWGQEPQSDSTATATQNPTEPSPTPQVQPLVRHPIITSPQTPESTGTASARASSPERRDTTVAVPAHVQPSGIIGQPQNAPNPASQSDSYPNLNPFTITSTLWSLFFGFLLLQNKLSSDPKRLGRSGGYEEAETGVPHGKFERTSNGFKVTIKRSASVGSTGGFLVLLAGSPLFLALFCIDPVNANTVKWQGGEIFAFIAVPVILPLAYWLSRPNRIEVTSDAISINKKRFRREHFHGFQTFSRIGAASERILGYMYGNTRHVLPGVWSHLEVEEMAAALNERLRRAGTGPQPVPENLRNTRPTDF